MRRLRGLAHVVYALPPVFRTRLTAADVVRTLALSIVPGGNASNVAHVLRTFCAACRFIDRGAKLLVSSLHGCDAGCDLTSPAECGCTIPAPLVDAATAHPDVVWVERAHHAVAQNAFARGVTLTTDIVNNFAIESEWGLCNAQQYLCGTKPLLDAFKFGDGGGFFPSVTGDKMGLTATAELCSTCSTPQCSTGFAFSGCNYLQSGQTLLTSPVIPASGGVVGGGLDGTGQLVTMVDSGLDFANPFFQDPSNTVQPTNVLPLILSDHSKVPAYFTVMDRFDGVGSAGHGTNTAGTVAGAPVTASAADTAFLPMVQGIGFGARMVVVDVGCNTVGGCTPPSSLNTSCELYPGNVCPQSSSTLYLPTYIGDAFEPGYLAGSRIIVNAWGDASGGSAYSATTADLDNYVFNRPDALLIFAAGNDNGQSTASLTTEAYAKNALTVGATRDGYEARASKLGIGIPNYEFGLFPQADARSCPARVTTAFATGVTNKTDCPMNKVLPSDAACYRLSVVSAGVGDVDSNWDGSFDLAMCCGCLPYSIANGAFMALSSSAFATWLTTYESFYSSRTVAAFSAVGYTRDARIKPDVVAPGLDVVTARAGGQGYVYNAPAPPCGVVGPTFIVSTSLPGLQAPFNFTGLGLATTLWSIPISTSSGVTLESVTLPYLKSSGGNLSMWLTSSSDLPVVAVAPSNVTLVATGGTVTWTVGYEVGPGWSGSLHFAAPPSVVVQVSALTTGTNSVSPCFGAVGAQVAMSLSFSSGGDIGVYTTTRSGTSQSAAVVGGLATIVAQAFRTGYYPSGAANLADSFAPSAALMKGVLVNCATDMNTAYLAAFLGEEPPSMIDLRSRAGFGLPLLLRGLPFQELAGDTQADGVLPTLLLPGLTLSTNTFASSTSASPSPSITGTRTPSQLSSASNPPSVSPTPTTVVFVGVDPSLSDGVAVQYCVDVLRSSTDGRSGNQSLPLSVTLVWTDPPSSPSAGFSLVNNLNLQVTDANGKIVLGNNDEMAVDQQSDSRNNVERVTIKVPISTLKSSGRAATPYSIIVQAERVFGTASQAYSLVITGPGVQLTSDGTSCGPDPNGSSSSTDSAYLASILAWACGGLAAALFFVIVAVAYAWPRARERAAKAATERLAALVVFSPLAGKVTAAEVAARAAQYEPPSLPPLVVANLPGGVGSEADGESLVEGAAPV